MTITLIPSPEIIGLEKEIEDPGTGAVTRFHTVRAYSIVLASNTSGVTLASWVSRTAFDAGKNPLAHVTVPLKVRPTGDCAAWPSWFHAQILASETPNHLSDAVAIFTEASGLPPAEEPFA